MKRREKLCRKKNFPNEKMLKTGRNCEFLRVMEKVFFRSNPLKKLVEEGKFWEFIFKISDFLKYPPKNKQFGEDIFLIFKKINKKNFLSPSFLFCRAI